MGCEKKKKRKRENLEVSRKQQQHKIMKPLRNLKDKNYNGLPVRNSENEKRVEY